MQENTGLMTNSDHSLLKRIGKGDRKAFSELYMRYYESFYKMVFARLRDQYFTEELLQAFWLRVYEDPAFVHTDSTGSAGRYMFTYLHYRTLDSFKNMRPGMEISLEEAGETALEVTASEYFGILEDYPVETLFNMIKEVLAGATETERKVYHLRIAENKTVQETAQELNLAEKTVHNKLSTVLGEIRLKLSPKYESVKDMLSLVVLLEFLA